MKNVKDNRSLTSVILSNGENIEKLNDVIYTPNFCKCEYDPPADVELTGEETIIEWNNGIVLEQGDLFLLTNNKTFTVTRQCFMDIHGTLSLLNTSDTLGEAVINIYINGQRLPQSARYLNVNPYSRLILDLNNYRISLDTGQSMIFTIRKVSSNDSTIYASNSNGNVACDLFIREVF